MILSKLVSHGSSCLSFLPDETGIIPAFFPLYRNQFTPKRYIPSEQHCTNAMKTQVDAREESDQHRLSSSFRFWLAIRGAKGWETLIMEVVEGELSSEQSRSLSQIVCDDPAARHQ